MTLRTGASGANVSLRPVARKGLIWIKPNAASGPPGRLMCLNTPRATLRQRGAMQVFLAEGFAHTRLRVEELLAAIPDARIVGRAESAREAIAGILASRPDVVIAELKLAEGDGFQVLREVHALEPGIDFYLLSNFDSEPYRRYAERLGAVAFLDKSAGLEPLRNLIVRRAATTY